MNRNNGSSSIRQRWALRYGLAVVAVAVGFGLRVALTAWIGPGLPTYITFYPAVMVAALLGGFGPGLLATALTGLTTAWWILPPVGQFTIASPVDRVGLVLFTGMGLFMSAVAEFYRRNRRKAVAYDQEMALREARREKEFLANLLEHASQPFAVGYPDGRLGLCNRAYEQLTGYSAEELRAMNWATTLTPPEWRELERQKLEELHLSAQPVRYEKEYIRKDGTRVPIELLVHLVKEAGDKPEYYYSFLTDITERKRVQTALRESEDRLNFALETSHTGAWDLDLKDHTAFRSLEHDRIFGYTELLPKWTYEMFLEHVLPEDRTIVDGKFRQAMESHGDWSFECRIRRTDEQVRWIWGAGRHRLDVAGTPRRMAGIVQDITERRQAEEVLQATMERFYVVLSSMYSAVLLVTDEGRVEFANQAFCDRFGLEDAPADLAKLNSRDMIEKVKNGYLHPDEAVARIREILDRGQPVRGEELAMQDGTTCLRDFVPLNVNGKSYGRLWLHFDITERKRAEEALRERERLLQDVIDGSPSPIFLKDRNGKFITINESLEKMLGMSRGEIKGKTDYDIAPREAADRWRTHDTEVMATGKALQIEEVADLQDGHHIFLANKFPLVDADGQVYGVGAISHDITERKQKETELRRLNRTLDALRHSSEAMMRAESEEDYLAQACSIVTNDCGHAMVWIGYAEEDEGKTVRPVAHAGFEEGYLETLHVTWADMERGHGPTGTAIRTGKPAGCRNMLTDPRFGPWREEAIRRGYASSIVIPLQTTGRPFGAVTIYSRTPETFSEHEIKLLTELGDDLAYGISAIRLRTAHAQAEQALRQSEERNREELERRVTERTAELHGAFHYARGLLEASLDPLVTISPAGKITDVNKATELVTGVPREQLIGSNFTNYFTEPDRAEAGYQKVLAEGLVRDYPLTIRHASGRTTEVLYNATVYRDEAGREQGVFAAARDITERVAAEKRREITHALLELFAHKASGKEYFDAVVEVIRNWTGCQCLGVRVLDERGQIPYTAAIGFDEDFLKLEGHLSVKTDQCFCIRAISQMADDLDRPLMTRAGSLRCDNAPGFMRQLPPENRGRYRGTCVKWGFASLAVIPIRYRDQVLGAIHLADRRPNRFPAATVEFLESMTPLIGEAIQRFHAEAELSHHRDHLEELVKQRTAELEAANQQLVAAEADLQRERDQLEIRVRERTADLSAANQALEAEMAQRQRAEKEHKKLLRRLADAQESERARISRELHDQLGQELTALKLGLRLVKNQGASLPALRDSTGKLEQLAGSLMQTAHRLAWELHPAVLDDLGLEAALQRYTAEWSEHNHVPVDFHGNGLENGRLPLDLETALYRVTQETLTNISRHAGAKRVSVLLERRANLVSLIVEDDGAGFDAAAVFQASRSRGKLGLLGMQERVTLAGGTIEIESTPGTGTTVFARIPLGPGNPTES